MAAAEIPVKFAAQTNAPIAASKGKENDRKAQDRERQAIRKLEMLVEETEREIERLKTLMESPDIRNNHWFVAVGCFL